jgi:hypothetical protein
MKDFSNASFTPEAIGIMSIAMHNAISALPHPVGPARVDSVAETILRSNMEGERDPTVLARLALMELLISPRKDELPDYAALIDLMARNFQADP